MCPSVDKERDAREWRLSALLAHRVVKQ